MKSPQNIELLCGSERGIYLPQSFVESVSDWWNGIEESDRAVVLTGPDHEDYWDAWISIIDGAYAIEESTGRRFILVLGESGDLFACCVEEMSEEEKQDLGLGE